MINDLLTEVETVRKGARDIYKKKREMISHFDKDILDLHDQDQLVRLIFLMLASMMVINDNFEKIPIVLFPSLLASWIRLEDPMKCSCM